MSEDNRKPEKVFKLKPHINSEGLEVARTILNGLSNIAGAWVTYGKEIKNINDGGYENYENYILNALNKLNSNEAALHFLVDEKHKMIGKLNKAIFKEKSSEEKECRSYLDLLILPTILNCEEVIANHKRLPIEQISIPTKIEKPVVIESKIKGPGIEKLTIDPAPETMDGISESSESIIFDQISCKATKEEILKFFMILSKAINPSNAKPYMSVAEITKMLNKSFTVFECAPTSGFMTINASRQEKGILLEFMYNFYFRYGQHVKNGKPKYAYFLKYNFELFANDTIKNIASNMGRKSIQNLIDLSKYGIN